MEFGDPLFKLFKQQHILGKVRSESLYFCSEFIFFQRTYRDTEVEAFKIVENLDFLA